MVLLKVLLILFAELIVLAAGVRWDRDNDPSTWSRTFEYKLEKLPQQAQVKSIPWSDDYWPSNRGGIANRWQDTRNNVPGFNYKLHSLNELKSGAVDVNLLSPAEKFDILHSRYDYPFVKSEWSRVSPKDADWEGLCHGWAAAAILYDQPNKASMSNRDGIVIPFTSSDIKALLTYFLGQFAIGREKVTFVGNRCNIDLQKQPASAIRPACWDINPGTFHVLMTNMLGLRGTSIIGDIDRGYQVWNQPLVKYEYSLQASSRPDNNSAPGTVKIQPVRFVMHYVAETAPSPTPIQPAIATTLYDYVLDLDGDGKIIGGSYDRNQWDRVDFLWDLEPIDFFGYFTELRGLYQKSVGSNMLRSSPDRCITLADFKPITVRNNLIRLTTYNDKTDRSWLIPNRSATRALRLKFISLNTRRYSDFVRIFEVENGEIQAPVAVIHGCTAPNEVIAIRRGVSALVTFSVDKMAARSMLAEVGTGFEMIVLR